MPSKTNPPLLVDSNTKLALSVAGQLFETIGGRTSKIIHCTSTTYHPQLSEGNQLNFFRQFLGKFPIENFLSLFTSKIFYHKLII